MVKKLTTEGFVEKARATHGDRYDYSKVEYTGAFEKVIVGCRLHGDFKTNAGAHTSGNNCPHCSGVPRRTTDEFKAQADEIHKGRYSYEKSKFVNTTTKLTVTCPIHGDFNITPVRHTSGDGCKKCSYDAQKDTTDSFIDKAKVIHNGIYSYSKAVYKGTTEKLIVTCPHHGDFLTAAKDHLQGKGCAICGGSAKSNTEAFVASCIARHGEKYSYEKTTYTTAKGRVIVTCHEHGDFTKVANKHQQGQGCPSCQLITDEMFKAYCTEKHAGRYNYAKTIYLGANHKITATCCVHGDFTTLAALHRRGHGCPACGYSGYVSNKPGVLYVLVSGNITKIGITNHAVKIRRQSITRSSGLVFTEFYSVKLVDGSIPRNVETTLLRLFRASHKQPENEFNGHTECFLDVDLPQLLKLINEQVNHFTNISKDNNDSNNSYQKKEITHV